MDERKKVNLDLGLVEDLKRCYEDLSLSELKSFMLSQSADGYAEAVEALESLGCPRPTEEEMQKYLSLGKIWQERNDRMREEEKRREEEERRSNHEKYWILRNNSPRLDAKLREAHRRLDDASRNYGRVKDRLWEKHKEYKRATDSYWSAGAVDYQFQNVLDNNRDARDWDNTYRLRWQDSDDLESLFVNWSHKLSLEEAKSTNLDEELKVE